MKKLTLEMKEKVQEILKDLPKEKHWNDDDYFCTYEIKIHFIVLISNIHTKKASLTNSQFTNTINNHKKNKS